MDLKSFKDEVEFDASRVKTKVVVETSFSKEIQILLSAGQVMKKQNTISIINSPFRWKYRFRCAG